MRYVTEISIKIDVYGKLRVYFLYGHHYYLYGMVVVVHQTNFFFTSKFIIDSISSF